MKLTTAERAQAQRLAIERRRAKGLTDKAGNDERFTCLRDLFTPEESLAFLSAETRAFVEAHDSKRG